MQGEWLNHLNYFEETLLRLSRYFPKVSRLVSKFWLRELNEVIDSNEIIINLRRDKTQKENEEKKSPEENKDQPANQE